MAHRTRMSHGNQSRTDSLLSNFSDDEFLNAVEQAEAVTRADSYSVQAVKQQRALNRVLGRTRSSSSVQKKNDGTPLQSNPLNTTPNRHYHGNTNKSGPKTNQLRTPSTANNFPKFDSNIESGSLSAKRNKLNVDDVEPTKQFSSPLQMSTPSFNGPAQRCATKTKMFPARSPLITSVQGKNDEKGTKTIPLENGPKERPPAPHDSEKVKELVEKTEHTNISGENEAPAHLHLSAWGLPPEVTDCYRSSGITAMFQWQAECLCLPGVLEGKNLVYSAPTSAGKTLVAELLVLKRVLETKRKAILILPFVSVAREKMHNLQKLFQDAGIQVDGFMGGNNPAGGFNAVDIAVCTIEKANSLINRLLDEGNIASVGTVVVDELHMVGDSHRGYLLELLLTKIRFMTTCRQDHQAEGTSNEGVQIVGMSATLPNLDLLGTWLDAVIYTTDFRPVPLTEFLKVGTSIFDNTIKKVRDLVPHPGPIKADEDHIVSLCLETMSDGCAVLIFCPTKNWCEKLAMNLANNFFHILRDFQGGGESPILLDRPKLRDIVEQLKRTPVGLDNMLAQLVPHGVAFHHAGLTFDERDIIEGAFRNGSLRILVATSTLSSGVNLPARRVLIRTPKFHGQTIDILTYKQMVGRAGRKGVDTMGESILLCKPAEQDQALSLMSSNLKPVSSCLLRAGEQLSSSMKRAILEVVVSGVAKTPAEVELYASCTMLAASDTNNKSCADFIIPCIKFLAESEFIVLKKTNKRDGIVSEQYEASQLGKAVLASALSPDEGLIVFAELQRARRNFVLENELHILYQVTPIYQVWTNIDWYHYLCIWESLPPDQRRVAECVGVSEAFLSRAVQGRVASGTAAQQRKLAIHRRFYTALVLQDLIQEVPLPCVAEKYSCTRGVLQSLQQSAATFAGMVTVFASQLGWHNLELLLAQFQSRLTFGVQRELVDLVRVSLLNGHRARVLFNAGYHTVSTLANAGAADIERLLRKAVPFESMKKADGESEWELAERRKMRCIWVTGQTGISEQEASVAIILEARKLVEDDLGVAGVHWKTVDTKPDTENKEMSAPSTAGLVTYPTEKGPEDHGKPASNINVPDIRIGAEEMKTDKEKENTKPPPATKDISCVKSSVKSNVSKRDTTNPTMSGEQVDNSSEPAPGVCTKPSEETNKSAVLNKYQDDPHRKTITPHPKMGKLSEEAGRSKIYDPIKVPGVKSGMKHNESKVPKVFSSGFNQPERAQETKLQHPVKTDPNIQNKDRVDKSLDKNGQNNTGQVPFNTYSKVNSSVEMEKESPSIKCKMEIPPATEIDEFNDSFELDTQLVNLISETSTSVRTKSPSPKHGQIEDKSDVRSNVSVTSTSLRKQVETLSASKPTRTIECASARKPNISKKDCPAMDTATPSAENSIKRSDSVKGKLTSPCELSLQLDLSNDDDLENFMDQYCTQWTPESNMRGPAFCKQVSTMSKGKTSSGTGPLASTSNIEVATVDVEIPKHTKKMAVNNTSTDDLWSDLEGPIDISTCEELALGGSFDESPKLPPPVAAIVPQNRSALNISDHEELFCSHKPVVKPQKDVQNVSINEEMAYMSLIPDSSALLELEEEEAVAEKGPKVDPNVGFQDDLSQYFAEHFGTYAASLNDSWSFTLNRAHQEKNAKPCKAPTEGKSVLNAAPVAKTGTNSSNSTTEVFLKPKGKPLSPRPSSEAANHKRKSEEMSPDCTPSKMRKTETANTSGADNKNDSTASDCVPPTPPEPEKPTPRKTQKTQSKKSTKKKSTKSSSQKSKRVKNSTCATQLEYLGKERTLRTRLQKKNVTSSSSDKSQCSRNLPPVIEDNVNEPPAKKVASHQKVSSAVKVPVTQNNTTLSKVSPAKDLFNDSGESLNQSIPLTNEHFTIIDVAADEDLFVHFLEEWKTKGRYTLCFGCEKLKQQYQPVSNIGGNFVSTKPVDKTENSACPGLVVERSGLQVVGLAVSWDNRDVYYISFTQTNDAGDPDDSLAPPPLDSKLTLAYRLDSVRTVLSAKNTSQDNKLCGTKVMFDSREQYKIFTLACEGMIVGPYQDPKVALWMLDPGAKEQSLHRMVHNRLPLEALLLEGLGGGIGTGSLGLCPDNPGSGRLRACTEAVLVSRLMAVLHTQLEEHNMLSAFQDVEMPVQIILGCMELNGFGFSEEECARQKSAIDSKLAALEEDAYEFVGHPFSLSSPDDIGQVLFMELKLPPSGDPNNPGVGCKTLGPRRTGGRGKRLPFSTSKDILEKLRPLHPLPGILLEWRRLTAALTKVVFPLTKEKVYNAQLGMSRIHAVSQTHTATGRVSMAEPNIQNIPKDFDIELLDESQTKFAVSMRHAFVPFKGGVLIAADYSQLELRLIAHLSHDRRLISILNEGRDVFRLIAAQWKGVEVESVTAEQRQQAKQVCYGMLYGIGAKALGEQLRVSEDDATVFIESFKAKYTGMRSFLRSCVQKCRELGYVETILGRRRYLPSIKDSNPHAKAHAERQAVNTTVQGSAADLVKKAMVLIEDRLNNTFKTSAPSHKHSRIKTGTKRSSMNRAYLLLQLHDELIYEVPVTCLHTAATIIRESMETAMSLDVHMPVKLQSGATWGTLTELDL